MISPWGLSVTKHIPLIRSVRQGVRRLHAEMGSQQTVRRQLAYGILAGTQGGVQTRGIRGRVSLIGLALSYVMWRA